MQARLLGWAGVQLRTAGSTLVIDPLQDAGAIWAPAGDLARDVPLPPVVAVVHAGDSLNHGWWWRIAQRSPAPIGAAFLPVNAPVVAFPHRQPRSPLPAVMDGREAAVAAHLLGAASAVAIHDGAYAFPPVFVPDPAGRATFAATAAELGVPVAEPELGTWFAVAGVPA
jgi:L-ascorbate metabolism protein UlaG (beta-lactamase superfamily)